MTANDASPASTPVRRRRWMVWILVPSILGALIGAALASRVTPVYRSEALLRLVPQNVPEFPLRFSAGDRAERFAMITQQITSRTRMERVIQEFGLYPEERRAMIMEDVIERMRDTIEVTIEALQPGDGVALRLGFSGTEPDKVMKVTERLTALFIREHLIEQEVMAKNAHAFLSDHLEDTRRRLVEKNTQLRAVKAKRHPEAETTAIEYEVLEAAFKDLSVKVEEARTAADGGVRQFGDKLQVIEEARAPERAIAPDWSRHIGAGTGGGAALGLLGLLAGYARRMNRVESTDTEAPAAGESPSS